jgi:hypothetical protein
LTQLLPCSRPERLGGLRPASFRSRRLYRPASARSLMRNLRRDGGLARPGARRRRAGATNRMIRARRVPTIGRYPRRRQPDGRARLPWQPQRCRRPSARDRRRPGAAPRPGARGYPDRPPQARLVDRVRGRPGPPPATSLPRLSSRANGCWARSTRISCMPAMSSPAGPGGRAIRPLPGTSTPR